MAKFKTMIRVLCLTLIFVILFCALTSVFERKTLVGAWNYTAKVNGYFNSNEKIDVVGFGSSHMYCSLNPLVLEKYNISSYVLATQQQPVKASYYYMLESLKTQKPKIFIFETFMVNNSGEDIQNAVIYDAIDPLPFSMNKLRMVYDLTKNKENKLPFFLTLLNYKERWKSLEKSDFYFDRKTLSDVNKGYVSLDKVTPTEKRKFDFAPEIQEINYEDLKYLNKMISLCAQNDIKLILMYAPFSMDENGYSMCYTMDDFACRNNLDFINGYELLDMFDFHADFYDNGHLNASGSKNFT